MADSDEKRVEKIKKKKAKFVGRLRLPLSDDYVALDPRKKMIILGMVAIIAVLFYFGFDGLFKDRISITRGALSSNHAMFEQACDKCHATGRLDLYGRSNNKSQMDEGKRRTLGSVIKVGKVTKEKCKICHEKVDDELGVYSLDSHYLYRSDDFDQVLSGRAQHGDIEMSCSDCHLEHLGRGETITRVSDSRCSICHVFESFNPVHQDTSHPEFEFAREKVPDDSTLIMTHNEHIYYVRAKLIAEGRGPEIETSCLYCHNPDPDGKNFRNINFEQHCGASGCHIGPGRSVKGLKVFDPMKPNEPGVETIEMIKKRGGPGVLWAYFINPNQVTGRKTVSKTPVYHEDPWILENMKQIRRKLYPKDGLFDLLKTSGKIQKSRSDTLYNEAIRTLRNYVAELQGRPEIAVKRDLAKIDSLLKISRNKLRKSSTAGNQILFDLTQKFINPKLKPKQIQGYQELVVALTDSTGPECRKCHIVDLQTATIVRVQADQDVLVRANFDHRAHIMDRACLACHTEIVINEANIRKAGEQKQKIDKDFSLTQNVPKIESCRECHNSKEASNKCVTCHYFHSNKENRSNLQLFVQSGR